MGADCSLKVPGEVVYKSYGETKLEIPYGVYTVSEIEKFLAAMKEMENRNKASLAIIHPNPTAKGKND